MKSLPEQRLPTTIFHFDNWFRMGGLQNEFGRISENIIEAEETPTLSRERILAWLRCWLRCMTVDKTIRRVTDPEQQQAETYRYWQTLSVGDRLSAVWDASEAAYAFAAAFKGVPVDAAQGSERTIRRVQRPGR